MSKKDDSPAISLFSFQDIITSITGIMFLVVLLLLLLIFEGTPVKTPPKQSAEDKQEMQKMAEEIKKISGEIQKYKESREKLVKQLREYQKMPLSKIEDRKNELEQRIQQLTEKNINTKNSIVIAKQQQTKNIEEINQAEKDLKDTEKNIVSASAENKKNSEKIKELKKRIETVKQTVGFSVEESSDKKPLLAEFTADGFMVLDFSTDKVYDLRDRNADLNSKAKKFVEWVKTCDKNNYTLSIILGPSKLKYWDAISEELRKIGITHGLELHPKDDMSIFSAEMRGEK
ncbi:MAG: hypothetical protein IKA22_12255 [Lentisphaeria bacterium]|nr:hypothetical protein [Lentisphaeria bacterium]